jgi:UDPglucose--hexose-1-phosphate uridylyltransferase
MSGIAKRVTLLSDGRELIYFDDADTTLPPERKPDERPPEPRPPVPQLRLDPLTGEWISIATARQNRAFLPPDDLDPLAPSAPGRPTEIPDNFDVAVFENKSPSFGPGLPPTDEPPVRPTEGRGWAGGWGSAVPGPATGGARWSASAPSARARGGT